METPDKKLNGDKYKSPDTEPDQKQEPSQPPSRRPHIALVVWMIIFGCLGALLIYNSAKGNYIKWDQGRFEKELAAGNIQSATISLGSDRTATIKGQFRIPGDDNLKVVTSGGENYYKVEVVYTDNLDKMLRDQPGIERKVESRDSLMTGLLYTYLPILILVALLYFLFSRQIKLAGKGALQFGKSRARMILPNSQKVTFEDVAGAEEAKEETKEIIDYLKDPLKFKMVGGKIPKGALLTGPPGTGKTLLAKAIAGEAGVPFFSISGSDFVEMFVGVGASRVRDMFEQARRHAPCLIFIDEIDAVGRSRFSGIGGGHDEREQTLNALLVEMDGLETQEGVIVLAATNRPDVLDAALLRPGRFDRQIILDLPDIKGRRQILEVHAKHIKLVKGIDLEIIARGTPGFSGADLANLINEAALLAARLNKKAVEMPELEEARDKVRWGRERKSRKISDKERKLTAYHEAGHTLVALNCPNATPVHKVTIIPRGIAYLGATMHLPHEDRYTQSRQEMLDELTVLMGGRSAEEIVFQEITTGAAADIEYATKIARKMVCAFGMSDKMGPVQYGTRDEHIYLGRDIVRSEGYSEMTSREIDIEIKSILDGAKAKAKDILAKNRDKLELLSLKLLEVETLELKDIEKLLGITPPAQQPAP